MATSAEQAAENITDNPNTASGKKSTTGMQGLSVRQKIYIGFGGLMLLAALNVAYTLFKLNDLEKTGHSVIEIRQPAANLFLRLTQDLNAADARLNNYLLTGQKDQREKFYAMAQHIVERISVARLLDVVKTGEVDGKTLDRAEKLINEFITHAQHLLHIRDNNLNNRGLVLAQDTINSSAIQFLNNANILVDSEDLASSDPKAAHAKSMLEELRYVWVSMMSNMRLFITTQGESHLTNFKNFNERAGVLLNELSQLDIEIGFGELEEMVEHRDTYNAGLPAIIEIFRTENWRTDSFMMKTDIRPILEELRQIFEDTADNQMEAALDSGFDLTEAQSQISSSTVFSFVIIFWMGTLLALKITGNIVPPIRDLMTAAKQISDGDLNAEVIVTTEDEIGMLGISFNTMVDDLRSSKLKELDLVDELSTINEELENRVEERTEELGRSESKVRAVLDNIGEGILVLDETGTIESINPAAQDIFKMNENEAVGLHSTMLIKLDEATDTMESDGEKLQLLLAGNASQQPGVQIGHRSDGSTFPMEYVVSSMDVGDKTMHVCIVRDITKRKETEATLAEAQATLVDSAHKSGMADMATGVLHNIGNILNSVNLAGEQIHRITSSSKINGFLKANELLEDHKEDLAEFLTTDDRGKKLPAYYLKMGKVLTAEMTDIQKETEELTSKTTMMKEVISTQQAYAQTGFHSEQLEIQELMEDALKIQVASLEKWGVKLHKHYRDTPPCIGQKSKLLQVITNLIKNAKEAMDNNDEFNKPKELTIETGALDDNFAYIKIVDNGCGISTKQLAKIFNHGFTTKETGHGFGLHTSANAMTEMRGSLKVDSAGIEKGARFTITIPIYKKAA